MSHTQRTEPVQQMMERFVQVGTGAQARQHVPSLPPGAYEADPPCGRRSPGAAAAAPVHAPGGQQVRSQPVVLQWQSLCPRPPEGWLCCRWVLQVGNKSLKGLDATCLQHSPLTNSTGCRRSHPDRSSCQPCVPGCSATPLWPHCAYLLDLPTSSLRCTPYMPQPAAWPAPCTHLSEVKRHRVAACAHGRVRAGEAQPCHVCVH